MSEHKGGHHKPAYLPVCGGVCDGYKKNRCVKCTEYYRRVGAGGHASRGTKEEPAFSQVDIIRANSHLPWSDEQFARAGIER